MSGDQNAEVANRCGGSGKSTGSHHWQMIFLSLDENSDIPFLPDLAASP